MRRLIIINGPEYSPAVATCVLLLAGLLAVLLLGYGLGAIAPENPANVDPTLAAQFISPEKLQPKPRDRFIFQAIVGFGFVVLGLIAAIWHRSLKQPVDDRMTFLLCSTLSGALALWLGLGHGLLRLFSGTHLLETSVCLLLAIAVSCMSVAASPEPRRRKWLLITTFLCVVLFFAATRIFTPATISYGAHITSHYEAVVYSIVDIAGGGTCLADVTPQYGCYGEFVAPIIRIIGPSPLAMTSIFVALQSLAMLAIIVFSAALIRTTALLLTAVGCIVILSSITLMLGSPDPVFQNNPIRLFFPALSLLCVLVI